MVGPKSFHFGLLLESLEDGCEFDLCEGVLSFAKSHNIRMTIFEGAYTLHYHGFDYQYEYIKDIIREADLDGLMICSGFMLEHFSPLELENFLENFRDLPMVHLGYHHKSSPSILTDSVQGLITLTDHLTDDHHCKSFAFITGPDSHIESNERLKTIVDHLGSKGISVDPASVHRTEILTRYEGERAAARLFDSVDALPDAIMCADDFTAIGTIDFLETRGISVPEDVVVTGFDDISYAAAYDVPLTTIKQSFYDMGSKGIETLLRSINKQRIETPVMTKTYMVPRRSCGCLSRSKGADLESADSDTLSRLLLSPGYLTDEERELIHRFARVFETGEHRTVEAIPVQTGLFLEKQIQPIRSGYIIQMVVKTLLNQMNPDHRFSGFLTEAALALAEYLLKKEAHQNESRALLDWKYNIGNQLLLNSSSVAEFADQLYGVLPDLNLKSFFLYIDAPEASKSLAQPMRLISAWQNGQDLRESFPEISDRKTVIQTHMGTDQPDQAIFLPLNFHDEHYGFMILDYNSRDFYAGYGVLRVNIGTALRSTILFERKNRNFQNQIDFYMNISHEIKTPLTLCLNAMEHLLNHSQTSSQNRDLNILHENLNKMNQDIMNLMDLNRIDKGLFIYNHHQNAPLSQIAHSKVQQFEPLASKHSLTLKAEIQSDILIQIDPLALDRIFNNLIENSIKYNRVGGTITVSVSLLNDSAVLKVSDTGIGISKDQLPYIFKPYYQIIRKKSNIQGIGMGLNIVRKIADSIQAPIDVSSEKNRGTTICLTFDALPNTGETPGVNSIQNSAHRKKGESADSLYPPLDSAILNGDDYLDSKPVLLTPSNDSILIVEDNEQLRYYLEVNLSSWYNVQTAENGREALAMLSAEMIPDLVISDIMMDKMDGFTFIEKMYSRKEFQNIPVIFLTARGGMEDKIAALKTGAIDYIPKPFMMNELLLKIRNFLNLHKQQEESIISDFQKTLQKTFTNYTQKNQEIQKSNNAAKLQAAYNLTEREKELCMHILEKLSHKEIASTMNLRDSTIRNLAHQVYSKCGVSGKQELINLCQSNFTVN